MKIDNTNNNKIKIGVLFSQSGPMQVSETAHLRGVLLACDEINNSGGINGCMIDPIILDPKGDDRLYAEMATELLLKHHTAVIFGCCSSSSRKAVLPIVECFDGILFYPSVYEGFEYSPNIIYGGGVPNQLVLPLLKYIYSHYGRRIALVGSDYIYPREINRIVNEFLNASGGSVVEELYFPIGVSDSEMKAGITKIIAKNCDVILSTVVGKDGINLYQQYMNLRPEGSETPIASLTAFESEMMEVDENIRAGHLAIAPYFSSLDDGSEKSFAKLFQERYGSEASSCVYSKVAYSLVNIFADAFRLSSQTDTDSLLAALSGSVFKSRSGGGFIDPDTNHLSLRSYIAKSTQSGQFDILHKGEVVLADPYLMTYGLSEIEALK
ncbi:MAG: transporter substrate-binding protein [Cellvibrionaceae bacterium]